MRKNIHKKEDIYAKELAAVTVPLLITASCVMLECMHLKNVDGDFKIALSFMLKLVISYFFPTIFSIVVMELLNIFCFKDKAIIKRNFLFPIVTIVYFFGYLFYWVFYEVLWFNVFFILITVGYILIVMLKCVDKTVFQRDRKKEYGNTKVKNTPN